MIGGERPLLPEILGQTDRVGGKSPIFYLFSLVAPQPSKKVQLSLIGSPLRAFQWAQGEHRTLSLSPQKWLKNAKCPLNNKLRYLRDGTRYDVSYY